MLQNVVIPEITSTPKYDVLAIIVRSLSDQHPTIDFQSPLSNRLQSGIRFAHSTSKAQFNNTDDMDVIHLLISGSPLQP
jgi:hypothetical protein